MLDTSVAVEALLPSEPGHAACVQFLRDLAASPCLVVFNRLLEVELYETLFNVALKERHGNRWRARATTVVFAVEPDGSWLPAPARGRSCWTRCRGRPSI